MSWESSRGVGQAQKEGVVTLAVLDYLMAAIQEGDTRALTEMGVKLSDVPWLLDMRLWDRQLWMCNTLMPVTVTVDVQRLNRIRERMQQQRASYDLVVRLARGDAPIEMMQVMCGMSRRPYRHLRRSLGLPPLQGGRPRAVNVPQKIELDALAEATNDASAIGPAECLEFAAAVGVSLADVWDWLVARRRELEE